MQSSSCVVDLGAEKGDSLLEFAKQFCKAGYAAVMFAYATFGRIEGWPQHTVLVPDQYQDYASIIDWTRKHTELDAERVIAWGTSFGGMHVTRLLSKRQDIAAGIVQCPCVDAFLASRMKSTTASLRIRFWAILDTLDSFFGLRPIYITMSAQSGRDEPALMIGKEAFQGWSHLHPPGEVINLHYNKICSRSTLSFSTSRPALFAHLIKSPYLIVVPHRDSVAPRQAAIDVAKRVEQGELVEVPGVHFDVYEGRIGYEQNLAAQLEFLKRVVPV